MRRWVRPTSSRDAVRLERGRPRTQIHAAEQWFGGGNDLSLWVGGWFRSGRVPWLGDRRSVSDGFRL
jgi:hypothetical protein